MRLRFQILNHLILQASIIYNYSIESRGYLAQDHLLNSLKMDDLRDIYNLE